jgi:hypothetical protein
MSTADFRSDPIGPLALPVIRDDIQFVSPDPLDIHDGAASFAPDHGLRFSRAGVHVRWPLAAEVIQLAIAPTADVTLVFLDRSGALLRAETVLKSSRWERRDFYVPDCRSMIAAAGSSESLIGLVRTIEL